MNATEVVAVIEALERAVSENNASEVDRLTRALLGGCALDAQTNGRILRALHRFDEQNAKGES